MSDQPSQKPEFMIQVGGTSGGSIESLMSTQDLIEGSVDHFQGIAKVIEAAGQGLVQRVKDMASKPTGCSIEFGVNIGGEAGIPFVTKGEIGSNFKITISWEKKD